MNLKRHYSGRLPELLQKGKVLVLYGPRRAGEDSALQGVFASRNVSTIRNSSQDNFPEFIL